MGVTHDDIRAIAALSRLSVPDDRLDPLVHELNGILQHMDALARVVSPQDSGSSQPQGGEQRPSGMRLAPDQGPSVQLERPIHSFAPASRDGFFLVPRLTTHDDALTSPGAGADDA